MCLIHDLVKPSLGFRGLIQKPKLKPWSVPAKTGIRGASFMGLCSMVNQTDKKAV